MSRMRRSDNAQPARSRAILGRWASMSACGVVAAALWLLVKTAIDPVLKFVSSAIASVPEPALHVCAGVVVAWLCYRTGRGRWAAMLGVRHFRTYPGLCVPVAVAIVIVWAWESGGPFSGVSFGPFTDAPWSAYAGVAIPLVVVMLEVAAWQRHVQPQVATQTPKGLPEDFEALLAWCRTDDEVTRPEDDRFGHDHVAQRIARRLRENEDHTIALLGPLGSGKSTIRALAIGHMQRTAPRYEHVVVSVWQFDTPEAAVAGILNAVLHALGKHTHTLPLAGLPEAYLYAMSRAPTGVAMLGDLLRLRRNPDELLAEVERVAIATDTRVVLWIEDLERFAAGHAASTDDSLSPIRSLLYLLHRRRHIAVVVCDTSLESRFDLDKIARFIEHPPTPSRDASRRTIEVLRSHCLNGWPRQFIDPCPPKIRASLDPEHPENPVVRAWDNSRHEGFSAARAIVELASTPRVLKSVLRLTLAQWKELCGEIDFDEILMMNAIRLARRDVFSVVAENIKNLHSDGVVTIHASGKDDQTKQRKARLEGIISQEESEIKREAARIILREMIPEDDARVIRRMFGRPQGICRGSHTMYWNRYTSEAIAPHEVRDQICLQVIQSFIQERSGELPAWMLDDRADQVQGFVIMFDRDAICDLLLAVVREVVSTPSGPDSHMKDTPGIVPILQMMLSRRPSESQLAMVLGEAIELASGMHPDVVATLVYNYTYTPKQRAGVVYRLLSKDRAARINDQAIRSVVSHIINCSREDAAEYLRKGHPFALSWTCRFTGYSPDELDTPMPPDWESLSRMLVRIAELDAPLICRVIAPFVTESGHRHPRIEDNEDLSTQGDMEFAAEIDLHKLERRFGPHMDRLSELIAPIEYMGGSGEQVDIIADALITWARDHRSNKASTQEQRRDED